MKRLGVVTWFDEIKGFGFLQDEATNEDVYVHFEAITRQGFRTLHPGERVRYELTPDTGGGPKAARVEVLPS